MTTLTRKDVPNAETKSFLLELADLLDRHNAYIEIVEDYRPYVAECDQKQQIEFNIGSTMLGMGVGEVYSSDCIDIAENVL